MTAEEIKAVQDRITKEYCNDLPPSIEVLQCLATWEIAYQSAKSMEYMIATDFNIGGDEGGGGVSGGTGSGRCSR